MKKLEIVGCFRFRLGEDDADDWDDGKGMFCLSRAYFVGEKGPMGIASQPEIVLSRLSFRDSRVCARSGYRNAVIAGVNQANCTTKLYGEQR